MGLEKQAMRANEAEGSSRKKCNRMPSGLPQGSGIQFLSIGGKARCMWSLRAEELLARGLAKRGDRIVIVFGAPVGQPGRINSLRLHTIEM